MIFENTNPAKIMELMDRGDFWLFVNSIKLTDEDRQILSDLRKEKEYRRKQTPNIHLEYSLLMEQDPDNWEFYWKEYQAKLKQIHGE